MLINRIVKIKPLALIIADKGYDSIIMNWFIDIMLLALYQLGIELKKVSID